jgi:hypothetical protein
MIVAINCEDILLTEVSQIFKKANNVWFHLQELAKWVFPEKNGVTRSWEEEEMES